MRNATKELYEVQILMPSLANLNLGASVLRHLRFNALGLINQLIEGKTCKTKGQDTKGIRWMPRR